MEKILITGGSGMVGRNLIENLPEKYEILSPSSKQLNLLKLDNLIEYLDSENPDAIVHCAGLVGGIQANKKILSRFFIIIWRWVKI